jgi:hypothetical protein
MGLTLCQLNPFFAGNMLLATQHFVAHRSVEYAKTPQTPSLKTTEIRTTKCGDGRYVINLFFKSALKIAIL